MTMLDNFARANARRYRIRSATVASIVSLAAITGALIVGFAIAMLIDAVITDTVALMLADPAALIEGR